MRERSLNKVFIIKNKFNSFNEKRRHDVAKLMFLKIEFLSFHAQGHLKQVKYRNLLINYIGRLLMGSHIMGMIV
jgi:hypothetical protein